MYALIKKLKFINFSFLKQATSYRFKRYINGNYISNRNIIKPEGNEGIRYAKLTTSEK